MQELKNYRKNSANRHYNKSCTGAYFLQIENLLGDLDNIQTEYKGVDKK